MIPSAFFLEQVAINCSSMTVADWKNSKTRFLSPVSSLEISTSESSSLKKLKRHYIEYTHLYM